MYYAIRAYEQIYGGLHGMEAHEVVECENFEEACTYASEMSAEVIEAYGLEDQILDREDYEDDEDEYEADLADAIEADAEYDIYLIDKVDEEFIRNNLEEISYMFFNDLDEFLEKYGTPFEEIWNSL